MLRSNVAQNLTHTTDNELSWPAAVERAIFAAEMDFPNQKQFTGSVRATTVFDMQIISMKCGLHLSQRSDSILRNIESPSVVLSLQHRGSLQLAQNNERVTLRPGQYSLYTSFDPVELIGSDGYDATAIKVPIHTLGIDADVLRSLSTHRFQADSGFSSAVWTMITQLEAGQRSPVQHNADVAFHVSGLINQMLRLEQSAHLREPEPSEAMRNRCQAYIDEHLGDPALSPEIIASNLYISTRLLHQLFEGSGTTVSGYIRHQRLRRVQQDLLTPELNHLPVSSIANRWGFMNVPHFSRLFKSVVGVPPATYRHDAQA